MSILKSIAKKLYFMLNIPKTLYVNFRALPINQAIHLPIYCGRRTKVLGLRRGSIVLEGSPQRGSVHIGMDGIRGNGLGGVRHKDSYLNFSKGSNIIFQGNGSLAAGVTVILGDDAKLVLGKNFSTNVLCSFFVSRRIMFGDDCFCGWNVCFQDGDGHYIINNETGMTLNEPKEISVGNHVWLCSDVTVLKGVTIANNCVVACGSMVTKSLIVPHSIYGGNTAKLLKSGISVIRNKIKYGITKENGDMK